jgi:gamma-D-glutamyl-L-lysine dipeptidyl-peptidase
MPTALCSVSVAPMRKQAAHESEMVNQLLFGETVQIREYLGLWRKVAADYDHYEGWVAANQLEEGDVINDSLSELIIYNTSLINWATGNSGSLLLPQGAVLQQFNKGNGNTGTVNYSYNGNDTKLMKDIQFDQVFLKDLLDRWVNAPYLWGGRTALGVDCSGFTQIVLKMMGLRILRDAAQQASQGNTVDFLQAAQCGDLAFFDDAEGKIYHVGILLDPHHIIHASGKVRIDAIDNAGIIQDGKHRTHKLRIIKRYF